MVSDVRPLPPSGAASARKGGTVRPLIEGSPPDPGVLCTGLAMCEALQVHPFDDDETDALSEKADIIVEEAERFRPDVDKLGDAWKSARAILHELSEKCAITPLWMLVLERLEDLPFPDEQ